jgi:hypothetical protein
MTYLIVSHLTYYSFDCDFMVMQHQNDAGSQSPVQKTAALDLSTCETPYPSQARMFLGYAGNESLPRGEAITPYLSLFQRPTTSNRHLKAIKHWVRDTIALMVLPPLDN